ncbi:MAG: hypothetical protein SX243_13140, partial [Acidobacteriota bacterium]|nr:hypothetical protein [Acidobacteriota bacterium]
MLKRPIFKNEALSMPSFPTAWVLVACCLAASLLAAPAVLAQIPTTAPSPAFSCSRAVQVDPEVRAAGLPGDPVVGAERLIYEASELVGPVEVRYQVAGALFATETADLTPRSEQSRSSQAIRDNEETRVEASRVIDLLALRPDVLRRLRAKAEAGETVTATVID